MPFCLKCGAEYHEDISECLRCTVELVEKLPEQRLPDSDWVLLKRFSGTVFAEMTCDVLRQNGILTLTQNHFMSSAIGTRGLDIPGMEVLVFVHENDYAEALALITGMMDDET